MTVSPDCYTLFDMSITNKAWIQFHRGSYNSAKDSSRICWLQIWINTVGKTGSKLWLDWHSSAERLICSVSSSCPCWCTAQKLGLEAGGVHPTPRLDCCVSVRISSGRSPLSYLHYFCWPLLLAVLPVPSHSQQTPFHIRPVYPFPPPRSPC